MKNIIANIKYKFPLLKRSIRFFFQRRIRGWDDSETWNLDHSFAKLILPRLLRFKQIRMKTIDAQFEKDLDIMIDTFKLIASKEYWDLHKIEDYEKLQKGLDLFAKHYFGLWD